MNDEFKRETQKRCCPGGWRCPYCGISPGKDRDTERRRARRKLKQQIALMIKGAEDGL